MVSRIVLCAIFLLLCFQGGSSARGQLTNVFGIGRKSCATWNSENNAQVQAWALGYWTGLHVMNPKDHTVGSSTDGEGIIEEVRLVCQAHPPMGILDAENIVYGRMEAAYK